MPTATRASSGSRWWRGWSEAGSVAITAKLMEENPLLVRLKELETLEKLSEKVERISVSGGFDGLLNNLLVSVADK